MLGAIGKAASWLIPSILSAGGALKQQSTSRAIAREQMAFQERMASTQAQRSKEDFLKAGLNPALAYGTQAASPSGASAQAENVLGAGVSSALSARANMAQVEIMEMQREKAAAEAQIANFAAREAEVKGRPWLNADNNGLMEMWSDYTRKRLQADINTAPMAVQALQAQIQAQMFQNVGLGVQAGFERSLGDIQRKGGLAAKILNSALMVQKAFQGGIK